VATFPTHAVVGLAVADLVGGRRSRAGLLAAGAILAALPDVDSLVAKHLFDHSWFDHRALTHGLPFALAVGLLVAGVFFRGRSLPWGRAALALVLAVLAHGALDAMTRGGAGVAFLSPFSDEEFRSPWRPIPVAPLSLRYVFSERAFRVLLWEALWILLPVAVLLVVVHRRRRVPA
jgi:inner membrane protein